MIKRYDALIIAALIRDSQKRCGRSSDTDPSEGTISSKGARFMPSMPETALESLAKLEDFLQISKALLVAW
jgi:hypothetical protein